MKKTAAFLLTGALIVMLLSGCGTVPDSSDKDLQQIAQINGA